MDVLVEGPFVRELFDPTLRWRGSRNQRVIRLSDNAILER
ncbi:4Fe-4S cluster-binding domain-containing protein [Porphyromonas loveana]